MPRPTKWRRVSFVPKATYFKPVGIPLHMLEELRLSIEEAEAIRLKDMNGLEQEQCAERMNISRPTFQRVLISARRKLADALINGKAIRIAGGSYELASRRFHCVYGHEWEVPFEAMIDGYPQTCPTCDDPNIASIQPEGFGRGRRGWGRGRSGRGGWQRA